MNPLGYGGFTKDQLFAYQQQCLAYQLNPGLAQLIQPNYHFSHQMASYGQPLQYYHEQPVSYPAQSSSGHGGGHASEGKYGNQSRGAKRDWHDAFEEEDPEDDDYFGVTRGPPVRQYSVDKERSVESYSELVWNLTGKSNKADWEVCAADNAFAANRWRARGGIECSNCNRRGHIAAHCPEPEERQSCKVCDSDGHYARFCPNIICHQCSDGHQYLDRCSVEGVKCRNCGVWNHKGTRCPDLWRRFHETTSGSVPVEPRNSSQRCYSRRKVFSYSPIPVNASDDKAGSSNSRSKNEDVEVIVVEDETEKGKAQEDAGHGKQSQDEVDDEVVIVEEKTNKDDACVEVETTSKKRTCGSHAEV